MARKPSDKPALTPSAANDAKLLALMQMAREKPLQFIKDIFDGRPWSKQEEIIDSVWKNYLTIVPSGHATGKDWLAARIALTFLIGFPNSIVITTGPTIRQVETLLWGEIRSAIATAERKLNGLPLSQGLSPVAASLTIRPKWLMRGLVAKDYASMTGYHSDHVLYILDEAAKLPDWVFAAAKACAVNVSTDRILAIGNPLCSINDPFYKEGKKVYSPGLHKVIHVSSEETPNVLAGKTVVPGLADKGWVDQRREELGVESDLYRAQVTGQYSDANSTALITPGLVALATNRWEISQETPPRYDPTASYPKDKDGSIIYPPTVVGIDCGRASGGDPTVLCIVRGNEAPIWPTCGHIKEGMLMPQGNKPMDGPAVAAAVAMLLNDYPDITDISIDGGGVGASPVDALRQLVQSGRIHVQISENQFGGSSSNTHKWANRRSELFDRGREWLRTTGILNPNCGPTSKYLIPELTSVGYRHAAGKLQMQSKDEIRKKIGRSTDFSDSFLLALSGHRGRRKGGLPWTDAW